MKMTVFCFALHATMSVLDHPRKYACTFSIARSRTGHDQRHMNVFTSQKDMNRRSQIILPSKLQSNI